MRRKSLRYDMSENIKYDIEKELNNIKSRMHGTHFEQDMVIISDAVEFIKETKRSVLGLKKRYQEGIEVHYQGNDESDFIECPMCGYEVASNDDFSEMLPKHCPECGTKLIY